MRALIVAGNLLQDQEFVYPFYRLQEAGYEVDVGSSSLDQLRGIIGIKIDPTKAIIDASVHDYDLVVIPGGVKAMEHLRLVPSIVQFIAKAHKAGKVIASICSGAQLLISAGLCRGRVISGYPAMQIDIENAGAEYRPACTSFDRIVTAPHYRDLGAWMSMVFQTIAYEQMLANEA